MVTKSLRNTSITIAIGSAVCIAVAYLLIFAPTELERNVKYYHVMSMELPDGVVCINQRLYISVRDTGTYSYRVVLQGNRDNLLRCLEMLEMDELNSRDYRSIHFMRETPESWWAPPSLRNTTGYRHFYRETSDVMFPLKGSYITKAELCISSNMLYIVQSGDYATLRRNYMAWK